MNVLQTIGLVVVKESHLLLVRKKHTQKFILPGGKIANGEHDLACLGREIEEELQCRVQKDTLRFLGEYTDVAANEPDTFVNMKLYSGSLIGTIQPANEIEEIHWFNVERQKQISIAPLVQNQIIPWLVATDTLSFSPPTKILR